jgi:fatty-acyl-CoA synthase
VCEAQVVDEAGREAPAGSAGEVIVRGPNVLAPPGYWRYGEAVLREGWFHTGDIGVRDADGHFYIHDRKKNLIISGGENIYPAEVERVLGQHPAVAECAVIARADPKWQEVPVAYIVPRAGAKAEPAEIEQFCLRELARYKVPREYVFVDSLPRNAMGKVQHFKLKALLAESADAPGTASEQTRDEDRRSGRWQWLIGGSR